MATELETQKTLLHETIKAFQVEINALEKDVLAKESVIFSRDERIQVLLLEIADNETEVKLQVIYAYYWELLIQNVISLLMNILT